MWLVMLMHWLFAVCLAAELVVLNCGFGNASIRSAQNMTKWFYLTRLETRTKESSICASSWVANLCAQ